MIRLLVICMLVTLPAATFAVEQRRFLPATHPASVEARTDCTECHADDVGGQMKPKGTFDHSPSFIRSHRFYAIQGDQLCQSCHVRAFCADCHAGKDRLSPSSKYPERPDRNMPHVANYLYQHRIDGRIDPAGCYRCHGRTNNRSCTQCHK